MCLCHNFHKVSSAVVKLTKEISSRNIVSPLDFVDFEKLGKILPELAKFADTYIYIS